MTTKEIALFFAQNLLTMQEDPKAFSQYRNRIQSARWARNHPEKIREANLRPEVKLIKLQYNRSEQAKENQRIHSQTDKGRATKKRYRQSAKGRAASASRAKTTEVKLRRVIWKTLQRSGCQKSNKTVVLLGCSVPEFRAHIEKQFQSWMTWENHGRYTWHLDHIKPCAAFDLTDPAQQLACMHFSNWQPLSADENLRKGAKWNG
jgi:hypothetical protein